MPNLITRASKPYSTGTLNLPFSGLPAAEKFITVKFTRESWPSGIVASLKIQFSNGLAVEYGLSGDVLLDKQGVNHVDLQLGITKPAGITSGSVVAVVLQPITTTITVDMV